MGTDVAGELRRRVAERAGHACEYCLIPEDDSGFSHQVDHIVSRKHGGAALPVRRETEAFARRIHEQRHLDRSSGGSAGG